MFKKFIDKIIKKYFDYDIVGDYYDTKGDGRYYHKCIRKYYLKCLKRKRKKGGHR